MDTVIYLNSVVCSLYLWLLVLPRTFVSLLHVPVDSHWVDPSKVSLCILLHCYILS